jgi:hypothetical protein
MLPTGVQSVSEASLGFPVFPNGTYYWQIRACDSAGKCGKWSSRATFVVER